MIEAFPLTWPNGWQRTARHERSGSRYQVSFVVARDELLVELKHFGARDVIISTNVPLRRDGLPFAKTNEPDDCGVAVYWTDERGKPRVMACDAWMTVRENMRALCLTIAAFRSIRRARAGQILERACEGFARLPENTMDWRQVFGFERKEPVTFEQVHRKYRAEAVKVHTDRGGNLDAAKRLNVAYELAKAELQ